MKTITVGTAQLNTLLKASRQMIFNGLDDKLQIFLEQYPEGEIPERDIKKKFEIDITGIDGDDKRQIISDLKLMSVDGEFGLLKEVANLLDNNKYTIKIQLTTEEISIFKEMVDLYRLMPTSIDRQLSLLAIKKQNSTLRKEDCFLNVAMEDEEEFNEGLSGMEALFVDDVPQTLLQKIKKDLAE